MKTFIYIRWLFILPFFSFPAFKSNLKTTKTLSQIKPNNLHTTKQRDLKIENLIRQMTDEEKIAQLFIVRTYAAKPVEEIFKVFIPGSFVHSERFRREKGYENWLRTSNKFQKFSLEKTKVLSLHMLNQEGGLVTSMKDNFFKIKDLKWPYFDIPGPLKLAASGNIKLVEEFAMELGKLLYTMGMNMNLAPVVDIFRSDRNGYIRGRSFSSDPYQVQKFSRAFTSGLQKAGIIATFKHFPGYTNTNLNSHKVLVTINLSKKDWIPYHFKKGFSYPKAIMINNAFYPQLDKYVTAPLSKKIITGILKQELAYEGLIITDDIGMKGYKEPDLTQRAVKSILAGNDMVLLTMMTNEVVIEIYQGVVRAFKQGILTEERINESLRKVLNLKTYLSYDKRPVAERVKSIQKSKEKLFQISKKMTRSMVDLYFEKNPDLKHSLSKDIEVISFSEVSYKAINSLKYFKSHKKNLKYFIDQHKTNSSLSFSQLRELFGSQSEPSFSSPSEKVSYSKKEYPVLFPTKRHIGFCYGRVAKFCHLYFSKKQKQHIVMIDTRNKPLPSYLRKQYRIYIPTYGFFPEVGELFLKKMIQSENP